jgi:hypothetical protein
MIFQLFSCAFRQKSQKAFILSALPSCQNGQKVAESRRKRFIGRASPHGKIAVGLPLLHTPPGRCRLAFMQLLRLPHHSGCSISRAVLRRAVFGAVFARFWRVLFCGSMFILPLLLALFWRYFCACMRL